MLSIGFYFHRFFGFSVASRIIALIFGGVMTLSPKLINVGMSMVHCGGLIFVSIQYIEPLNGLCNVVLVIITPNIEGWVHIPIYDLD